MDNERPNWFWLVVGVGALLLVTTLYLIKRQNEKLAKESGLTFKSEVVDKFNDFAPDSAENLSSALGKSLVCTAKSFSTDKLELAEGFYSIFTANCYYHDASNREKYIKLPLVVTNQKQTVKAGFSIEAYDPRLEQLATEKTWVSILGDAGFVGAGHIFTPALERADPSGGVYGTFQGLGAEAMARYYSDQDFINFANTGDPRYLNGILWTSDVGLVNTLNGITPERLPNITPN
jgi:hypothetical protein